jgi:hypothetical protein
MVEAAGVELFNLLILCKLLVPQVREMPKTPLCRVGGTKTVQVYWPDPIGLLMPEKFLPAHRA